MRRLVVMCILLFIAVVPVKADPAPVVVVYFDSDYNVQLYRQSTGEKTFIASADEAYNRPIYLSPSGEHVAIATRDGLALFTLSPVRRLFTRDLYAEPYHPVDEENDPGAVQGDFYASGGFSGAWSPDGSRFAWTEGTPGTGEGHDFRNGDGTVAIFSALDGSVSIMSNEPGMPFWLNWSPDSSYLLYTGIYGFGTGAGPTYSGIFVVDSANQQRHIEFPGDRQYIRVGDWLSNSEFMYSDYDPAAGSALGVSRYDLSSGTSKEIIPYEQYNIVFTGFDSTTQSIVVEVGDEFYSNVDHSHLLPTGIYTLDPPYQTIKPLQKELDFRIQKLVAPDLASGPEGILRLSNATITIPHDPVFYHAIYAPNSPRAFVDRNHSIVLVNLENGEEQTVYSTDTGEVRWLDGQTYFALIGTMPADLTVNTVDGITTTVLEGIRDYYLQSPQLAYESELPHFPLLEPNCPGLAPLRLAVGQSGRVIPATSANNIRNMPYLNSDVIGKIPSGETFEVLAGPVCREDFAWWKVKYQTIVGWTAELQGNDYFIEPFAS